MHQLKIIFYIVGLDIKRVLMDKYFYIAIFATCILLFTMNTYKNEWGKEYGVLSSFAEFTNEQLSENFITAESICEKAKGGGELYLYGPMLSFLPLLFFLVTEKRRGAFRLQLFRVGKTSYVVGKLITTILVGGSVIALGYLIFCGSVYVLFPHEGGTLGITFHSISNFFFYGASTAVLGYIISSFVTNVYLVYCVPFIFNYFTYSIITNKIGANGYGTKKEIMLTSLKEQSTMYFNSYDKSHQQGILIVQGCILLFSVILYRMILQCKVDCGE